MNAYLPKCASATTALAPSTHSAAVSIQDRGATVAHLEIVLMHPIPPVNIQSWSLSINYAPVYFRTRNIDVWLPQSAEVYRESETGRTFTSHKFTDFRLFSVDVNQEPNSPQSR